MWKILIVFHCDVMYFTAMALSGPFAFHKIELN